MKYSVMLFLPETTVESFSCLKNLKKRIYSLLSHILFIDFLFIFNFEAGESFVLFDYASEIQTVARLCRADLIHFLGGTCTFSNISLQLYIPLLKPVAASIRPNYIVYHTYKINLGKSFPCTLLSKLSLGF